jgi:hypothetical protein
VVAIALPEPQSSGQSFHLKKKMSQMAESSDFGTFGRYQETPINEMSPAMKDA